VRSSSIRRAPIPRRYPSGSDGVLQRLRLTYGIDRGGRNRVRLRRGPIRRAGLDNSPSYTELASRSSSRPPEGQRVTPGENSTRGRRQHRQPDLDHGTTRTELPIGLADLALFVRGLAERRAPGSASGRTTRSTVTWNRCRGGSTDLDGWARNRGEHLPISRVGRSSLKCAGGNALRVGAPTCRSGRACSPTAAVQHRFHSERRRAYTVRLEMRAYAGHPENRMIPTSRTSYQLRSIAAPRRSVCSSPVQLAIGLVQAEGQKA